MAARFRGEFNQRVDGKGRMSIPARFRRVLEQNDPEFPDTPNPQLVILYGDHLSDFMEAYTMAAIEEIEDRILSMEHGANRAMLQKLYINQALTCEVDKDGRVVVPKEQREKFALAGDVIFRGMGDHFQIWPDTSEARETSVMVQELLAEKPRGFSPLELLPPKSGAGA